MDAMAGPPREILFRRRIRPFASIKELWHKRELVRTLAERDLRVRYKQTFLGFTWAVITPLLLMFVFAFLFGRIAKSAVVDTGGAPRVLFVYVGLLPWTFFTTAVSQGGQSLVANSQLLNKVYCPREVFPLASVVVGAFDTLVSTAILGLLFIVTGYAPRLTTLWAPVLLAVQIAFMLGVSLVISAILVYLRDLRHALPFILQIGLFVTPVAYGIQAIPEHLRVLYAALNPLAPVIEGYRRTILLGLPPDWDLLVPGAITSVLLLSLGYILFKRLEMNFADVA